MPELAAAHSDLFSDLDPAVYTVRTETFEGPLDLLLFLIRKNEVDIYNIPIAAITRQYLDYLEIMKELNLDIAGEFLVMASTLVQIKSRMLLPSPEPEEAEQEGEDPRAELVRRLLEYQRYRDAADQLVSREQLGREVFARKFIAPEFAELIPDEAPPEVDLFELIEAFRGLLAKVPEATFHEVGAEGMTIADRINEILDLLRGKDAVPFERLFVAALTREYVIVTFLALLELCKLRIVKLLQANNFGVIWISPALLEDESSPEDSHARSDS